jgi:hypothetical protein
MISTFRSIARKAASIQKIIHLDDVYHTSGVLFLAQK